MQSTLENNRTKFNSKICREFWESAVFVDGGGLFFIQIFISPYTGRQKRKKIEKWT